MAHRSPRYRGTFTPDTRGLGGAAMVSARRDAHLQALLAESARKSEFRATRSRSRQRVRRRRIRGSGTSPGRPLGTTVLDRACGKDARRPSDIAREHNANIFHMVRRMRAHAARLDAHKNRNHPVAHPVFLGPPEVSHYLPMPGPHEPNASHPVDLRYSRGADLHGYRNPHPHLLREPSVDELELFLADTAGAQPPGSSQAKAKAQAAKAAKVPPAARRRRPRASAASLALESFIALRILEPSADLEVLTTDYTDKLVSIPRLLELRAELLAAGCAALDELLRPGSDEHARHIKAFKMAFVRAFRAA
ncbi:uncharacterized protein AMSG_01265 [Thecamonas trahens ATCC 50062]|uniref:Uncharacterized protein n=1 Tax=Thecamonas trahens ATCC 50062 TaxID=461836 RepID=A0A0L0DML1_THETB|nr:hypothetical protein AMSG_01265 [Thecamonas trahens ATCC 50062]KNC53554.1 hypothetical protein AMSG_01265 [Thecamonas trahens ATCC 50062]|eukprot:XP_013761873.1 hypothetical protein AMSG_01265 [Thecamonas trahens ATCC 50062]